MSAIEHHITPGARVGATYRTTPVNTSQPWLKHDHRGTVMAYDPAQAARLEALCPGYTTRYVPVAWDFGAIYREPVEHLFPADSPPPELDWSRV